MLTKMGTVTKKYRVAASPKKVFEALTNKEIIEQWSGSEAEMNLTEGGTFSLWEGDIHGINQKISEQQIVQDWKEKTWEAYSRCTFNITADGESTMLELIHENIPESSVKSIDGGWDDYYLGPLKELLESEKN